jgi:hypothetical protein
MKFVVLSKIIQRGRVDGTTPFPDELWTMIEEHLISLYVPMRPSLLDTITKTVTSRYTPWVQGVQQSTMLVTVQEPKSHRAAIQRCVVCGHIFVALLGRAGCLRSVALTDYDCSCDQKYPGLAYGPAYA